MTALRRLGASVTVGLATLGYALAAPSPAAAGAALTDRAASPAAASPAAACWKLVATDDFRDGTARWFAELENGGSVTARDGKLDIDVPGGATVWFKRRFQGPITIEYTATPISAGGPNDHVTDLNTFWNARDGRSPDDLFATRRSGTFADYDLLKTYYVGFGGNLNTTTRMRRYVGEAGNRPLLFDRTEPLLVPNQPVRVRLVAHGDKIQYWANDQLIFNYVDPEPYTSGWFALRTVASHFTISDFAVWRPRAGR